MATAIWMGAKAAVATEAGPVAAGGGESWRFVPIARIEHLKDAVYGAGLEATQMSRGTLAGSLAFAERGGILYSSGSIGGKVALRGPLSRERVTLGLGLRLNPGSWHWFDEVSTGNAGLFLSGDEHDCLYVPGSLYATATLGHEQLERQAALAELVLDARTLGGTGIHPRKVAPSTVAYLARRLDFLHAAGAVGGSDFAGFGEQLLDVLIAHYAREPRAIPGRRRAAGHARIVARARAYIAGNLQEPLTIEGLADVAATSRRTLYRAFLEVLGDTPQSYVRRLRLHRIRHDLASEAEAACTVALAANRWGVGELGRLSGWYRELFGELPSQTLAQRRRSQALAA